MSPDIRLDRLQVLAEEPSPPEADLHALAMQIGSDIAGLRALVNRFADSTNPVLLRYVAVPLAHAPWDLKTAKEDLNEIVLDFIRRTSATDDVGTLSGSSTALQGLNATGLLAPRTEADRTAIGSFLIRCLNHRNVNVRGACLHLMGHLYADGALEYLVAPQPTAVLKKRLAGLAREEGDEFRKDLEPLRGFWKPGPKTGA